MQSIPVEIPLGHCSTWHISNSVNYRPWEKVLGQIHLRVELCFVKPSTTKFILKLLKGFGHSY